MLRRRKIWLIEPRGRLGRPLNVWIRRYPLLGPILLATISDQRGYEAAVYNENISGPLNENRAAFQEICSADVVGISIMTASAARGYVLADLIRNAAPSTTIAIGGIHATFMPFEALGHADLVIRGEGENVIEAIAAGEIKSGIIDSKPVENLDCLPTPNLRLMLDFDKLVSEFHFPDLCELPVMASRGCPYGCRFCSVTRMFGRQVRRQSVSKVCTDISHHVSQGFRHFLIYDDNVVADRLWARALMDRLAPLNVRFSAQTRADFHWVDGARTILDTPLLEAMQRAGGRLLFVGYETLDDATAQEWHKGYRGQGPLRQRLLSDTAILREHGFRIHGMFVVGPQHTQSTLDGIFQFVRETHMDRTQIGILTPYPGTPLLDEMHRRLVFTDFPADWEFYDGSHCVFDNSPLGLAGLQTAVLETHRRIYRGYGWRLRRIRNAFQQRTSLLNRLRFLQRNTRMGRHALGEWEQETQDFIRTASTRQFLRGAHEMAASAAGGS